MTYEEKRKQAQTGFTVVPNLPEPTEMQRPNLPGSIPTPLTVDLTVPGGVVQAGNRMLYVPPTGPTQTNFPTSRDIALAPQQVPLAPETPPIAPAPVPVAPPPAQPTITALTTNAQMDEAIRNAVGMGRLTEADKAMAARLALQSREGGPRGAEAQKQLTELGVTASSEYLLSETNQMAHAKEMRARVSPQTLPPAQRKIAEADYNRAFAIYSQQREQAYAEDTRKMAYDIMQAKWGNERLRTAEIQGQIDLNTENILNKQLERQLKEEMAPYELGAAKTKAELDAITLQNIKSIQEELTNPDTVKADELVAAPTIDKYKQTWDQGSRLATRYNFPEPVRNELHLGILASSYDSPVELAKDSGVEINEDITSVSQSDVAKYAPDITTAISNNVPPDQAVEQILRDSGKEPSDKGYPQLALNISAGVWKQYRDAGEAAMAEAKAAKIYSDAQNRQKAVTQIAQQIPQLSTAGGWNDIVASTQKRLDRLALIRGMKTGIVGEQQGVLAEARIHETFGLGASEQYTKSTSEQIKGMIINHLAEVAGNDPSFKMWLADQATNPDSEVSRLLTMGVNEARKGQKSEMEEQEKVQAEKKVIEKENADKGLATAFKPGTAEVEATFSGPNRTERLNQYENLDTAGKATMKAIEDSEIARAKRIGEEEAIIYANLNKPVPVYTIFNKITGQPITLPYTEKGLETYIEYQNTGLYEGEVIIENELARRRDIMSSRYIGNTAFRDLLQSNRDKIILDIGILEDAASAPTWANLDLDTINALRERGVTEPAQAAFVAKRLRERWGLPTPTPEPKPDTGRASAAEWKLLPGEQPANEPPTLTPEEAAKLKPGEKFKTTDGRIITRN